MRADQLAEQVPIVRRATTGAEAARIVAEFRLNALVVGDESGVPIAVVPGSQLLSVVLPQYVRDDPKLAHAYDEAGADELCTKLRSVTLGELIDAKRLTPARLPKVNPDDTLIEIASMMDENHTPLIVVMAQESGYLGVVTMTRVLAAIARAAGEDSDLVRRRLDRDIIDRGTSGFLSGRDDSAGDDEANGAGSPEAHTS